MKSKNPPSRAGDPERAWAEEVVGRLRLAPSTDLDGMVKAVARHLGRPLVLAEVEGCATNGKLEDRGGITTICVPGSALAWDRRRIVCRGLARAIYRAPGARDGRPDYRHPVEREVEFAAMALVNHLRGPWSRESA
ncbi:hypothetical protein [Streptacidiphilus jiangxiensis]|uniref:Uncharacterized protein n=1 Tax=Streptacidiphilus jiangxiensis TaxID=235985 RepID=A0A1H8B7R2_STRJI|nr:hypothetical protein [Streptacidiphilus jiangxiensis]SEM78991.1 hypothetical protein SAMN05414137_1597 [Streptacidiphilus jiangxiensis]